VSFNYTPLVDVTFNLILYFVLTTTLATAAMSRIMIPRPHASQAIESGKASAGNKLIVSVVSAGADDEVSALSAQARTYEIDSEPIRVGDKDKLVARLKAKRDQYTRLLGGKADDFTVEIRADRRVSYSDVEPILMAAAEAKIPRMNITAQMDRGGHQ
jgi:biopolymer transport protein ExbD